MTQSQQLSFSRFSAHKLFPHSPKNQPFISQRDGYVQPSLSHNPSVPLSLQPLLHSPFFFSLKQQSFLTLTNISTKPTKKIKPRRPVTTQSKGSDESVDVPDRLISAVCYFYPFFDGIQYGKNSNFSRYVRFNTMQVIVLDVLLIFPDLVERSFNPKDGLGLDVLMSLDSTVFLFLLVCLIYGSASCVLGQVPRLPIVAEAAERQVP
ncbi:unnamed protein product [Prunus armeniaca]|uniref:Protein TIC 20 n=1 Tax=Prunus armeniaca TaxID=36596 RepID=A0A6J5X4I7_PRUAR|nr:unnamed protein product [Prunus armeniaca]